MEFTHRNDPARTATVVETEEPPSVAIHHVDAAGKARRKTLKGTGSYAPLRGAQMKALRFLLGEGFILRAPQDGPLRWMTQTEEPYSHGFAATRQGGDLWVGDTGFLRSVTPGTCTQTDLAVGELVMPRSISASSDAVYALLDSAGEPSTPPFRAPAQGDLAYRMVKASDGRVSTLFTVPHQPSDPIFDGVSAARDGRFVGPHADGAALYGVSGEDSNVIQSWAVAPTRHHSPTAAISPDGAIVAWTGPGGSIVCGLDASRTLATGFEQVHALDVRDSGTVYVSGLGPEFWGYYRLRDSRCEKLSDVIHARASDSEATLVTVASDVVTERFAGGDQAGQTKRELRLPWLGMAKQGAAIQIAEDGIIVRTDAHTIAGVQWPD